jgi:hypothetical protein
MNERQNDTVEDSKVKQQITALKESNRRRGKYK